MKATMKTMRKVTSGIMLSLLLGVLLGIPQLCGMEVRAAETVTADVSWYTKEEGKKTYTIKTDSELLGLRNIVNGYDGVAADDLSGITIVLGNDIDMNQAVIETPIGSTARTPFSGTFDGGDHSISNFKVSPKSSVATGLFGNIKNAAISNLKLKDATVAYEQTGYNSNGTAGLAGAATTSTIKGCSYEGSVSGTYYVGALIGKGTGLSITDCTVKGTVTVKNNYSGGIAACLTQGSISGCDVQADITSTNGYVGGIAGQLTTNSCTIENCSFNGKLSGASNVGGIAGSCGTSSSKVYIIKGCTAAGTITSSGGYVGGIAGSGVASIYNCENTAEVQYTGTSSSGGYVGGIVGYYSASRGTPEISACINRGTINSNRKWAGGIAGRISSKLVVTSYCANLGTVTAGTTSPANAGGICSEAGGSKILYCYTTSDTVCAYDKNETYQGVYCVADGTSSIDGITYCTMEEVENGTLKDKLNSSGVVVWEQPATGEGTRPGLNKNGVKKTAMSLDGMERVFEAEYKNGAFEIELPHNTDLSAVKAGNFRIEKLYDEAVETLTAEDAGNGLWKLSVKYGENAATEYSIKLVRAAEAWKPEISKDLSGEEKYNTASETVTPLVVAASIYDDGTLSYQWYQNSSNSIEGATKIEGATEASYTPVIRNGQDTAYGITYYYAVITNTATIGGEQKSASVTSGIKKINVQCTVTYKDTLFSKNNRTEYVDLNGKASPKTLSQPGYTFVQWGTTQTEEQRKEWDNATAVTADTTLYAWWNAIHYSITLPASTEDYTVAPKDETITDVLYDGEYSFTVVPKDGSAFVLVKANGVQLAVGADNVYKITDIREDQVITVEYAAEMAPDEAGVYTVKNEAELISVMKKNANANIRLAANITWSGATVCATKDEAYSGVFDGNGFEISGLRGPMFGWIGEKGVVENLTVSGNLNLEERKIHYGDSINVGGQGGVCMTCPDYLAPIAGISYGTVRNCFSSAAVTSKDFYTQGSWGVNDYVGLGGLVGNNFGLIENCGFSGTVTFDSSNNMGYGGDSYGGIASASDGIIRNCYNTGKIDGACAGGIVGRINNETTDVLALVENCYNVGSVSTGGGMMGGAIAGYTGAFYPGTHDPKELRECLRNNYFQSGSSDGGVDGSNYGSIENVDLKAKKVSLAECKGLELVKLLNQYQQENIYLCDTKEMNNGYPIFAFQGSPVLTSETAAVQIDGKAAVANALQANVTTELPYEYEWLLLEAADSASRETLTVIEQEIPALSLELLPEYLDKYVALRVRSTQDGSVITSPAAKVEAPEIKGLYAEGVAEGEAVELTYYETEDNSREEAELSIKVNPASAAGRLQDEKILCTSEDETVAVVSSRNILFDAEEGAAQILVEAKGVGTTSVTVQIGEYQTKLAVTVYPAFVEAKAGFAGEAAADVTAESRDLKAAYEWNIDQAAAYVTPLHVFEAYVSDTLGEEAETYITVTDGKVTAVNGETGDYRCSINHKVSAIDTLSEVKEGDTVTFFKKTDDITTYAFFEKDVYEGEEGQDIIVKLNGIRLDDTNQEEPVADAVISLYQNGEELQDVTYRTAADGSVALNGLKRGSYVLKAQTDGAVHTITTPYAEVVVTEPTMVTAIEIAVKEATIHVGETCQIKATAVPENAANRELIYTSADESIASVDKAAGVVTGKAVGTTTITIAAADGSGISAVFTVKVEATDVKVTGITLPQAGKTLKAGETYTITAGVAPADATNKKLTYASSNPSIASVDAVTGLVTAKKAGTVTITVRAADGSGRYAQMTVVVNEILIRRIKLGSTGKTLNIGASYKISSRITPANATKQQLRYSSSKRSVVSVDAKGVVKAKKAGTAYIIVKAKDGSKKSAKLKITVRKATIKLNKSSVTIKPGKTNTSVKIRSSNTKLEKIKSAKINNKKLATVRVRNGKLTIKAKKKTGTATITITSTNGATAKVKVNVKK